MSVFAHIEPLLTISRHQRRLLESLLRSDPQGADSFETWLAEVDFDALDHSSFRLIPAVFRRRAMASPDTPHYGRMKGIYRYFLYRNSLLLAESRKAVSAMSAAGIKVALFKGGALTLQHHRNNAVRPMADVDVLVPEDAFGEACDILLAAGWTHSSPARHSCDFVHPQGHGFDLHRHALHECDDIDLSRRMLARAQPLDWDGLSVTVLAPQDLILTSLCNGVRELQPRLEWIWDIATILDTDPDFDFAALWREASDFGLRDPVFHALNLANSILVSGRISAAMEAILDTDRDFQRHLLTETIAEGRSATCIAPDQRGTAMQLLATPGADSPPSDDAGGSAFERASRLPGHARHIHFRVDEAGTITELYLQRRHLPRIGELFRTRDRQKLRTLIEAVEWDFEGPLAIPDGLLEFPKRHTLRPWAYRGSIELEGPETRSVTAGETVTLKLRVKNRSSRCWPAYGDSPIQFGVSLHVRDHAGKLLTWDTPRFFFTRRIAGYVSFIEPGEVIDCEAYWIAPEQPGHFRLDLDLVHERIMWFSRLGGRFPRLRIDVRSKQPT